MKTADLLTKIPKDNTSSILRLERNNTEISTLRHKLSSYVCEPKTASLYERLESLKTRLEHTKTANQEVIEKLKGHRKTIAGYKSNVVRQLKEFKDLEKSVFEYIGMARQHC